MARALNTQGIRRRLKDPGRLTPHGRKSFREGNALFDAGEFGEAVESYETALSEAPDEAALLMNLAQSFLRLGQLDTALQTVERVLTLDADDKKAHKLRRQILDGYLWRLVDEGFASWSGGKPKGSHPPIEITPGPPISDYIVQDRDLLRAPRA